MDRVTVRIPERQIKVIIAEWAEKNGEGWNQSDRWVGVNPDDIEIVAVNGEKIEIKEAIFVKRN